MAPTYKQHTGLGIDTLRPRWFAWLSPQLLEALAIFLNVHEAKGCWPSQIMHAIVALIPKATGGTRPHRAVAGFGQDLGADQKS